jgi:hypothetical protein
MIFPATQADNDRVWQFFRTMLRSAVEVERPLTPNDATTILLGSACEATCKAEDRIAAPEHRLAQYESQPK